MRPIVHRSGAITLLELSWESEGNNFRGLLGHFGVAFGDDPLITLVAIVLTRNFIKA